MPGFDDSKWDRGKAPIGKGAWTHRYIDNATVKYKVDNLEYESFRLSILARQGFHVYLNSHKIHTYIWWKDEPYYRPIVLTPEQVKHLKKGVNVLAAYANVQYDRRTQEPHASIDLAIEGITKEDKAYVSSKEYILKQMDKVCTRREQRIIAGASNAGSKPLPRPC
ncbi:MAG: hypothetical protein ACYSU5_04015 [Planctomycetota bacterium]|jgi:hypothetical protein